MTGSCREVGRRRGALAGPFPTPSSRTRRDRFRSPGSPATIPRLLVVGHRVPLRRYALRIPHGLRMSGRLCPFALWTAFPSSLVRRDSHDYYGHSVTLGLAPCRRSRVRPCCTSERDLGVPFISLIALTGQRSTLRRLRRQGRDAVAGRGAGFGCLSGGRQVSSAGDWAIRQCSFRHITRVPRRLSSCT